MQPVEVSPRRNPTSPSHSTALNNYKIDSHSALHRSGGKVIYKGWKLNGNLPVTIKVMDTEHSNSVKLNTFLKQTLKTLKLLDSKYIFEYLEVIPYDSKIYLVSEQTHHTLEEFITKTHQLSQKHIINLFYQLCLVLKQLRDHPEIIYTFSFKDVYVMNSCIKLDCFALPQNKDTEEDSDQHLLAKVLKKLTLMIDSLGSKQKTKKSEETKLILGWCKQPLKHKILSLSDLSSKLKSLFIPQQSQLESKTNTNHLFCRIDKVLLNELNYIIFLQKLIDMLDHFQPYKEEFSALNYLVQFNLKIRINKLYQVSLFQNVYQLEGWESYVQHPNFRTYLQVIQRLYGSIVEPEPIHTQDKRLQSIAASKCTESEGLLLNYQFYLRRYIGKLKCLVKLSNPSLTQSQKSTILLLDYLLSAYQINGIHIEYYRDPYMFATQSYLDSIIKGTLEFDPKIAGFLSKKLQLLEF